MKFAIVLAILIFAIIGGECASYDHHLKLKDGIFEIWYGYSDGDKRFHFKAMAETTGWVGFGMTHEKGAENMKNYDIILGGVKMNATNSSIPYLGDYWSTTTEKPKYDAKQNVALKSAMEKDGKTILEFNRLADTGDTTQDIKIERGKAVYFAWARGDKDAVSNEDFQPHGDKAKMGRGHTTVGYDMYTGKEVKESTGTTVLPSIAMMIIPALMYLFP